MGNERAEVRRYMTHDMDKGRVELTVLAGAGNGDIYIGVVPEGFKSHRLAPLRGDLSDRLPSKVRVTTSGERPEHVGVAAAVLDLWRALGGEPTRVDLLREEIAASSGETLNKLRVKDRFARLEGELATLRAQVEAARAFIEAGGGVAGEEKLAAALGMMLPEPAASLSIRGIPIVVDDAVLAIVGTDGSVVVGGTPCTPAIAPAPPATTAGREADRSVPDRVPMDLPVDPQPCPRVPPCAWPRAHAADECVWTEAGRRSEAFEAEIGARAEMTRKIGGGA